MSEVNWWWGIAVVVIGAIIVASAWTLARSAKRVKALAAFAQANGYEFREDGFPGGGHRRSQQIEMLGAFYPFTRGILGWTRNLLTRQDGIRSVYVFDCGVNVRRADEVSTESFTVVAVRHDVVLPKVTLEPQHVGHSALLAAGFNDLAFESEEFNQIYYVRAEDAKSGYDVLHPLAIDYLLTLPRLLWQVSNFWIVLAHQRQLNEKEIEFCVKAIHGFLDLLPSYVRQDRGFTPTWQNPLDP